MIEIGKNLQEVIMTIIGCVAIVTILYLTIRDNKN